MRPEIPWFSKAGSPRGATPRTTTPGACPEGRTEYPPGTPRRVIALSALAVVAAGCLAACSSSSSSSTTGGTPSSSGSSSASSAPITIGASLSLTGDFSADGQAFQKGYQLWAADVNAKGGLLGRQVKVTILNDASNPNQVVTNHENLLFGPFSSLLTAPASQVANRYGYAFVEGAGGAPAVFGNGLHNLFDVSLPVKDSLVPFANWIASLPASQRPTTASYPTS